MSLPAARRITTASSATGVAVVLAYHAIADRHDDPVLRRYSVPPCRFTRQLDWLASTGWTFVDANALLDALAGREELPRRAVLVTFDDGYADFLQGALPALRQRRIPSVVFVVSSQTGGVNDWDQEIGARPMPLMDPAALRRIAAEGVEIGSHAMRHVSLATLDSSELLSQVQESAAQLASLGLPRPRLFSYPYGHHTPEAEYELRSAGYEAAFTVTPGTVEAGASIYALPRVMVLRGYTPPVLRLRLATLRWRSERLERWFDVVGTRG